MLWGYETLKGGRYSLYNLIYQIGQTCNTFLELDWKQFDKRTQFEMIDDIHSTIRSFMAFDDGYIPMVFYPERATEASMFFDVFPDGDTYVSQYFGTASGYFETQLLKTQCVTVKCYSPLSREWELI